MDVAIPVFPVVPSMIDIPWRRSPRDSAARTRRGSIRSLTLPLGLKYSTFIRISAGTSFASCLIRTIGVSPAVSRMLSYTERRLAQSVMVVSDEAWVGHLNCVSLRWHQALSPFLSTGDQGYGGRIKPTATHIPPPTRAHDLRWLPLDDHHLATGDDSIRPAGDDTSLVWSVVDTFAQRAGHPD